MARWALVLTWQDLHGMLPMEASAVKLDDLPLHVLMDMQNAMVNAETEDREALREAGAGYFMIHGELGDDTPTEIVETDDKLMPGEQAVHLRFRAAS